MAPAKKPAKKLPVTARKYKGKQPVSNVARKILIDAEFAGISPKGHLWRILADLSEVDSAKVNQKIAFQKLFYDARDAGLSYNEALAKAREQMLLFNEYLKKKNEEKIRGWT